MGQKQKPSGNKILQLARKHLGEKYVFGVVAPKNNPKWKGPWDCAEFTSWLIYQTTGKIYGCYGSSRKPESADAYSGKWREDAKQRGQYDRINNQRVASKVFDTGVNIGSARAHRILQHAVRNLGQEIAVDGKL